MSEFTYSVCFLCHKDKEGSKNLFCEECGSKDIIFGKDRDKVNAAVLAVTYQTYQKENKELKIRIEQLEKKESSLKETIDEITSHLQRTNKRNEQLEAEARKQ